MKNDEWVNRAKWVGQSMKLLLHLAHRGDQSQTVALSGVGSFVAGQGQHVIVPALAPRGMALY